MAIHNGHARWAFDLSKWKPGLEELLLATTCIQVEEKTRLAKFVFRDDFNASLIGRLLMRKFVHDTTGQPYDEIKLCRDDRGRPYHINQETVRSEYHIDFNVSHQGSYSVLAGYVQKPMFDTNIKIGADVMKIEYSGGKPLNEFFRLMTRNFSNDEWCHINQNRDRLKTFMRHWCLKESFVKNVGTGITVDLQKISFKILTEELSPYQVVSDTVLKLDDVEQIDWTHEESLLDENHCVAVSLNKDKKTLDYAPTNFELIHFNELVASHKPLLLQDLDYCRKVLDNEYK
jgi:phosphopantetheine--protein transferase-like protein